MKVSDVLAFGPNGWPLCFLCQTFLKMRDRSAWDRHQRDSKVHKDALEVRGAAAAPSQGKVTLNRGVVPSIPKKVRCHHLSYQLTLLPRTSKNTDFLLTLLS
jgi:hypothetical protein